MVNQTINASARVNKTTPGHRVHFIVISFVISISIIAINLLVMFLHRWKRSKLTSNRLLLSLSVCDFFIGIGISLTTLSKLFPVFDNPDTTFGFTCRIMMDIYTAFLVKTVVMHLCGITMDRYISLFYALHYQAIVTKKSTKRYIFASWMIPFTASSIQWIWLYKVIAGNVSASDMDIIEDIEVWYSMVSFTLFFAIPLIALGAAFFVMLIEVRRIIHNTPYHEKALIKISAKQRRVILVYGMMYLSFVILATPYFSLRFLIDINNWMGKPKHLSVTVVDVTILMRCFTSIANPVLYTSTSVELRSLFKEIAGKLPGKEMFDGPSSRMVKVDIKERVLSDVEVYQTTYV